MDDVVSVYRSAFGNARPIDGEELLSWIRNPELDPESLRVLERDGSVVGYGDVVVEDRDVALEVAAPGHWETFLEWAEAIGRKEHASRVRVLSYAGDDLANAAKRRGYRLWRSNYTMRIEFGDAMPPSLDPPPGIELRPYAHQDLTELLVALNEAFAGDPFFHEASEATFRESFLHARGFEPSLWLLAWDRDELAGFVLPFSERAGDTGLGVVRNLGVRPRWRRRGLGESLLRAAFRALHARGLRAVELGVDASNETGAVRLYERVGMHIARRGDNWALDLS